MRQIPLDIRPPCAPTFDNFVPGDNAELMERLLGLATPHCYDSIYLWGEAGSGCSHLLMATAEAATDAGRPLACVRGGDVVNDLSLPSGGLLIVDEAEHLGPDAQIALFRAYNTARIIGLSMLVAGNEPPRLLQLREDLRTRIGQALIYQVQPLSDEDKVETLLRHARSRGLSLEPELINYLLRHGRRDLGSLLSVLDSLDEQTLAQKRHPTLPLLREILAEREKMG